MIQYYRMMFRLSDDALLDELLWCYMTGMEDGAATGMLCTVQHAPSAEHSRCAPADPAARGARRGG